MRRFIKKGKYKTFLALFAMLKKYLLDDSLCVRFIRIVTSAQSLFRNIGHVEVYSAVLTYHSINDSTMTKFIHVNEYASVPYLVLAPFLSEPCLKFYSIKTV